MNGCDCGAPVGWHKVACITERARQKAPTPPEGAADPALLAEVAEGFACGDYQGNNENARAIAGRLLALADWLESLGGR